MLIYRLVLLSPWLNHLSAVQRTIGYPALNEMSVSISLQGSGNVWWQSHIPWKWQKSWSQQQSRLTVPAEQSWVLQLPSRCPSLLGFGLSCSILGDFLPYDNCVWVISPAFRKIALSGHYLEIFLVPWRTLSMWLEISLWEHYFGYLLGGICP